MHIFAQNKQTSLVIKLLTSGLGGNTELESATPNLDGINISEAGRSIAHTFSQRGAPSAKWKRRVEASVNCGGISLFCLAVFRRPAPRSNFF
jgi:hypothetical protein